MRDFDKHPYSADEQRVADWIDRRTGTTGTPDPIGFLITGYEYFMNERQRLLAIIDKAAHNLNKVIK